MSLKQQIEEAWEKRIAEVTEPYRTIFAPMLDAYKEQFAAGVNLGIEIGRRDALREFTAARNAVEQMEGK